jgi:CubicO group peptidase (beta-lactamase class C family)
LHVNSEGFSLRPDLRGAAATRIADILQQGIDAGEFPGAQVYVSHHGNALVDLALGQARLGVPMTPQTIVSWQCNTKPVTATAVALLWERGLLELDDPVARYLPDFAENGKQAVTVRHLLAHAGGFADDPPLATLGALDLAAVERLVCESRLDDGWEPGTGALYSSWYGYATLGVLVGRVDSRPFPRFVREQVFGPLGMDGCWIGVDPGDVDGVARQMAFLYQVVGDRTEPPPIGGVFQARGLSSCSPASGGIGPMRELARLYESLLDSLRGSRDGLLAPETVQAMVQPVALRGAPSPWGLGPLVVPGHFGTWCVRAFGHDGLRSSLVFADPEHGVVMAAIVNSLGRAMSNIDVLLDVSRAVYLSVLTPAELAEVGLVVDLP